MNINIPFDNKDAMDADQAKRFFADLTEAARSENFTDKHLFDPRAFFSSLAIALCRISPLVDSESSWGGRTRTSDKLLDRYNEVVSYHTGYEVSVRVESGMYSTILGVAVRNIPHNPDKLCEQIGSFSLKLSRSNAAWEILGLVTVSRELSREPAGTSA